MKWLIVASVLIAGCNKAPETPAAVTDPASPAYKDVPSETATYKLPNGTATATVSTETFSNSLRVKSNPNVRDKKDEFRVVNLTLVEEAPSGRRMLQTIVAIDSVNSRPPGIVTKVAWSSQEFGNLFKLAYFDKDTLRIKSHSYLDGEADQILSEPTPAAAVLSEDALMLWARGLAWPVLKPNESRQVPILFALHSSRLKNSPRQWGKAILSRTPAEGIDTYRAKLSDGRELTYEVEQSAPFRLRKYGDAFLNTHTASAASQTAPHPHTASAR